LNASTVVGSIIIAILLAGAVGAGINLSLPQPATTSTAPAKYKEVYVGKPEDYPNVKTVNLKVSMEMGGIELKASSENLVYMLGFSRKAGGKPLVKTEVSDGVLTVSTSAASGGLEILLGRNYVYNIDIFIRSGGFKLALSDQLQVESLKVTTASGGGYLSLEGSSGLKNAELSLGNGGIVLDVKAEGFKGRSNITVNVDSGGVIVKPLKLASDVGCRIKATVESGGISFKPENFTVVESTRNKCEMKTSNYDSAVNRLDILLSIGKGGALINQELTDIIKQMPQAYPQMGEA
jgi:hypothetical protein